MKYSTLAMLIIKMVITTCLTISFFSYGAVTLDRTRIIFPGNENAVNITIINDNPEEAYLAQSWIEDINGNKLTKGAILATPPLQRVEPKRNSLVRLSKTPEIANLPKDRESILIYVKFHLNQKVLIPYKLHYNLVSSYFIGLRVF